MDTSELSFALADESTLLEKGLLNGDSLDLANLADFEDETTLVNDLIAASISENDADPSSTGVLADLDVKFARLLGVLEHASSDTSAQVERAISDVSRSVPRLTFDLQLMRENVTLLRFTLDNIRKRSIDATAHNETSKVMRRLKVLDTIKTRMEAARDVLREAEAWSTLESEVTGLVQEQAYIKAAERLSEANKSMVVFQNTPEYEARRSLMVSLQNGLEAGLSTSLVSAINARDMEACKSYYGIFGQIQRETEFRNYYFGSRRTTLLREWQSARLTDCPSSASTQPSTRPSTPSIPPTTFSSYLPAFYASFEKILNEERTYIPAIFPDPVDTLASLLQTTLEALIPSFPQRISDLSNSHGPRLLLELIKIYHATEEFAIVSERVFARLRNTLRPPMASPGQITGPGILDAPTKPGKARTGSTSPSIAVTPSSSSHTGPLKQSQQQQRLRRQSKTLSISRRQSRGGLMPHGSSSAASGSGSGPSGSPSILDAEEQQPLQPWETTLFEPFLDWQAEYSDLELRLLQSELSRVVAGQDAMAYLLSTSSPDDEDGAGNSAASNRRKGGAKFLLEQTLAVFGLAEEALGRTMAFTHGYGAAGFVEAVDGIFKSFLLKERDTLLRAKDTRSRQRPKVASAGEQIHMEYSQEDWSTFELAMRLFEACKVISERIVTLEQKVRTRLVDVARLLKEARSDPSTQVVPGTTKGALLLLYQSTLNSAALNNLLDSVEQQDQAPSSHLFTQARSASLDLTRASQLFLHDTILGPIMQTLENYPNLAVWTQTSESRPESRGAFDLHIPTFSLSPSETITRVGEGFLNLPGMFEVYAEDEALGFSLDTLPDLDSETVKNLRKDYIGLSPLPSPQNLTGRHRSNGSVAHNEFLPSSATSNGLDQASLQISPSRIGQEARQQPLSAEVVISTWLSSLTRSVLLHLTVHLLPSIRALSKHGADQLFSDLGYLSNVAKALDVEVEQVEKWRIALEYTSDAKKDPEVAEQLAVRIEENEMVEVVKRLRARYVTSRA
jgi:hypothetical protein